MARSTAASATVLRIASPTDADADAGRLVVDEWGRDARLIDALAPFAHLRWAVSVTGAELVARTGALIIVNTRRFALTPIATAWAIGDQLDRPVRFVGRPDVVPFGPLLRRSGGLLAQPAEIAGALRAGELVLIGADSTSTSGHAGRIDAALVGAAISEKVPVHLAAVTSSMTSRNVNVRISAPLRSNRQRRGPLAEVELAETARRRLQELLDEPVAARLTAQLTPIVTGVRR